MSKHYDVAVLGQGLGALVCAALLARRSWRVLVIGQGSRPATYTFEGHRFARRSFAFVACSSPAWTRVLVELAQSQTFRRKASPLDPMFSVLTPRFRLDVPPSQEIFAREIDREFPLVRRVIDDLYAELARTNAAADAAFDADVVWPPGTFWERRETRRFAELLPHLEAPEPTYLSEFPRDHPYRDVFVMPAERASDLAGRLPPFALARLHGAWTRGVAALARGEDELTDFLQGRVRAHGGELRLGDRVRRLVMRSGKVAGVEIEGDPSTVGVQFVVSDGTAESLLGLARDARPGRRVLDRMPTTTALEHRFVTSVIAREEVVPAPLAVASFMVPDRARHADLVDIFVTRTAGDVPGTVTLTCEAIVGDDVDLHALRERSLGTLEQYVPFLARHVVACDSPHDGRPLWWFEGGRKVEIERARVRPSGASVEPEAMVPRYRVDPASFYDLPGEPVRAPVANAFLTGPTVLPALGQEGQILAAWSAARIITRTDRGKERMRREMWSKVELS